jgi:hypothetical protein
MANQITNAPAAPAGAGRVPLSDEAKAARVERWRGNLAGAIQPEVISFPAEVDRLVELRVERMRSRPSPLAEARMRLELYLWVTCPDEMALWMDTPVGPAVIAVDEEEFGLFSQHFPNEVCARVHPYYPINAAAPLSEGEKASLVEKWRGILAGTIQPEVIKFPAEVDRLVEERVRQLRFRVSPAERAQMRLDQYLGDVYPTETVLTMDTPAGPVVMAAGDEEVRLFWHHFPDEREARVKTHYGLEMG